LAAGERLMTRETVAEERFKCSASAFRLIELLAISEPFSGLG